MPNRADHRRQTLLALGAAATDLFERDGPTTTVDAIAERAGVSRRTAFRYVESKEELAFVAPILWLEIFDESLLTTIGLPLADRILAATQAIGAAVDADPEPVRRAFIVAASHPALSRGFSTVFQRWVDRIAQEAESSSTEHARDAPDPFRSRIIGSAVMGTVDAITREWLFSPRETTYSQLCQRGFDVIAPLFD